MEQRIEEEIDVKLSLNTDRFPNFAGVCILIKMCIEVWKFQNLQQHTTVVTNIT